MLLRRFTSHVKDQNWFAVALDFFIVVAGVIVAFQLQAWGERRAAAERAERSLHQLYEESEEALQFWVRAVADRDRDLELQDRVLAALHSGERGDLTDDEMISAVARIGRYPTLTPPRRTYDELSGAGLLAEIDAPEAMAAVATYYEDVDFIQGQIGFFRPGSDEAEERHLISVYDPTRWSRQRLEVDLSALAADRSYLSTLVSEYRNMMMFQIYRRETMLDAAAMCTALAEAVGETCAALAEFEAWRELPEWQMRLVPPRED